MRGSLRLIWIGIGLALSLPILTLAAASPAAAAGTTFSNTTAITVPDPDTTQNGFDSTGSLYPSPITVSGLTGNVSSVTVTLSGITSQYSQDLSVMVEGPGGQALSLFTLVGSNTQESPGATHCLPNCGPGQGGYTGPTNGLNVTLDDNSTTTYPYNTALPTSGSLTMQPADDTVNTEDNNYSSPPYDTFLAPAPQTFGHAASTGTDTLTSTFGGTNPNGTWKLWVVDDGPGDGGASISGGWSLAITSGASVSTTTTVQSSNDPSFTASPGNAVTFTTSVTSGSPATPVTSGTVDFTDGGTTIAGCGSVALDGNGQAACATSFSTEGIHSIKATYSGTASTYVTSSATVAQEVDDHTTVSGSSYCNTGTVSIGNTTDAMPYPQRVFVSNLSGTIGHLSVTLNGVSDPFEEDIYALLVGPNGKSLVLVGDAGPDGSPAQGGASAAAANDVTLTFDDSAASSLGGSTPWGAAGASVTTKPVDYGPSTETWGPPAPASGYGLPATDGSATLASQFNGASPDGTWSLYIMTVGGVDDAGGQMAGGWCANITTSGATATNTTLTSSTNPSFTAAPSNDTTFTATIEQASDNSPISEGTVDFTSNGITISGCGAVQVSAGTAACTTSFSAEGEDVIQAQYSGDQNFGPSNASLTQEVDDHTTESANSYCNTGSIALNTLLPSDDAAPYPSRIFVTGLPGTLSHLSVTLKNVSLSYSADIQALLVGPNGNDLILVSNAGENGSPGHLNTAVSDVTLTLDDASATTLAQAAQWGSSGSSVTSKPVNYEAPGNYIWPSPAPASPYGNPGPSFGGADTLSSEFNGANPNGTWSLYVITTGGVVDGTGAIAGGWCVNTTINKATPVISGATSPSSVTIGGSFNDTATAEGPSPDGATDISPTGTVTFNVYGPGDPTCSNGPVFTSTESLGSGPFGPVTATSSNFTPTTIGTYFVTATYNGDLNYSSGATSCGDVNEQVVVTAASPSLATTASPAITVGGGNISDSAVLSGGVGPTGSITFDVYGPNDPNCSAATPTFTSTVTVTGNGTYPSGTFTPTAPGTYRFTASYNGDTDNFGAASACNASGESVVVSAAQPTIATAPSASVAAGGTISDSALLSGGDSPTGTITFEVYGPNDPNCSAATPTFTSTVTVTGDGTYGSGNFTAEKAGTYAWVATYNGDTNNATALSACGASGELVSVTPASPSISTTSSGATQVGGTFSDSATLSGGVGPTGSITFDVYGPNDQNCSALTPTFTSTIAVAGNGTYGSGGFTPTAPGTYTFVASYSGDSNNSSVASSCPGAGETVTVTKATPSLVTTASASVAVGSGTISDSAVLSGGQETPTGSITFDVYGPNDPNCSAATPTFTSTAAVTGNGTYTSGAFTPTAPGTYLFTTSYDGDSNNSGAASACNASNESVVVSKASPTVTSLASSAVVLGHAVSDTATIAGGDVPTGTVTFKLYGANDPSCASTPVFTSSPITVGGDGQYSSGSFTPTAGGTYHWVADYSGDANNGSATSRCGDPNESVVIGQVSSGTTLTSSLNPSIVGQQVTLTATVTGTDPTGTVTFKDGSSTLGSGTLSPSGVATLQTSSLTSGNHVITAAYGGDANNAASTSDPLTQVVNEPLPGAPMITITSPTSGASYAFEQPVHAQYSCNEGPNEQAVESCTGTVPNGAKIDTATPGNHTFTVNALSTDDKTSVTTVTYHVRLPSNRFSVLAITADKAGTITAKLKLPWPGTLDFLVTAWNDNLARAAYLLQPAPHRFVFARWHGKGTKAGGLTVTVPPNAPGRRLLSHPDYPIILRLWISYTPKYGRQHNEGFYGLQLPGTCGQLTVPAGSAHAICSK